MKMRPSRNRAPVSAEQLESRCLLSISTVSYGANLVTNGGAESFSGSADGNAVITPTGWTASGTGGPTVSPYGSGYGKLIGMPKPADGGNDFFSGGKSTAKSDFFQTIDLSSIFTAIDANRVTYNLSAYLGGNGTQNDAATVFVNFQDASHSLLEQDSIGPVLASDRGNKTEMLFRSNPGPNASVAVPDGTRFAQVQIHFEYTSGTYDDAFADEVSLVLSNFSVETAGIGGTVYNDANGNGHLDGSEQGIPGTTVYDDANNNGKLDPGERTSGTKNGEYFFANLPTGTHHIRAITPSGYKQTQPSNNNAWTVTLSQGQQVFGDNFGEQAVATGGSVTGTVTGAPTGETVYLDANNNSKLDSGEFKTTTVSGGAYKFTNIPADAYIIRQLLPSGYKQTTPANGLGIHITVKSGGSLTSENFTDASTTTTNTASISGEVFKDSNDDGKLDNGELGLSGWTVYLDLNNSGVLTSNDPKTTTKSGGVYTFTNLAAGTYIVRVVRPSGWAQTSPAKNLGQHITLASGQKTTGILFGEHI